MGIGGVGQANQLSYSTHHRHRVSTVNSVSLFTMKVALQQLFPTELGEEPSWTTAPPAAREG
jgi:hypothetical protein